MKLPQCRMFESQLPLKIKDRAKSTRPLGKLVKQGSIPGISNCFFSSGMSCGDDIKAPFVSNG